MPNHFMHPKMIDTEQLDELKNSLLILHQKGVNHQAEKYIEKHKEHFKFLDELSVGTALCDYKSGSFLYLSEHFKRIYSVEKNHKADMYGLIARIIPEDQSRFAYLISEGYRLVSSLLPMQQNGCEMRCFFRVRDDKSGFKWIIYTSKFIREENVLYELICANIGCEDQMEPPLYLNLVYGKNRKCINYETESATHLRFSDREKEVLFWSERALSVKQISERLFISEATVRFHRKNILSKMGMKNFIQVMNYRQNKVRV